MFDRVYYVVILRMRVGLGTIVRLFLYDMEDQGSGHRNNIFKYLKVTLGTLTLPRACIGRSLVHWVHPFILCGYISSQWVYSFRYTFAMKTLCPNACYALLLTWVEIVAPYDNDYLEPIRLC